MGMSPKHKLRSGTQPDPITLLQENSQLHPRHFLLLLFQLGAGRDNWSGSRAESPTQALLSPKKAGLGADPGPALSQKAGWGAEPWP